MRIARMFCLAAGFTLAIDVAHAQVSSPSVPASQAATVSPTDLIRRAFQANRDLAAARLDLERGRARLRQAGLRPNPTLDAEYGTGRLIGSPDESETSVGVALPIEIGGRRQRRIDVAFADLAVIEAEIANRERELMREVLTAYVEAVAATKELEITERIHQLNEQMAHVVRTRVAQQDAPPLELSLLLTEIARLDAREVLLRGRVDAALISIGRLIGAPSEPLHLRPAAVPLDIAPLPNTLDAAIAMALERRADVIAAKRSVEAAGAGVRLARAEAWPELTVSVAYRKFRGISELPSPLEAVPDLGQVVAFGASVGFPLFNKNQGARAEAAVLVRQAGLRRDLVEQTVRAEVTSALRRAQAAEAALKVFEQEINTRSDDNIRIMRAAYELGEFRLTDVITEQRQVLETQEEYAEALTERYRAIVDLRAAIGLTGVQP